MATKNLTFPGSTGAKLAASIDLPEGKPRAWALFGHCFTCNRKVPAASRICRTLAKNGIAAFRFDFTGLGESEGDFGQTTFLTNVNDLLAAYSFMEQELEAPSLLVGHSLGGAAALKAGSSMPKVKAVATVGAPYDPAYSLVRLAQHVIAENIHSIDAEGTQLLPIEGREIPISRDFLEVLADVNAETYIYKLRKPLLILHSPTDDTVGVDASQKIFRVARYPKSLITLDQADHMLIKPGAAQHAAKLILAWSNAYLPRSTND